ncbi:MAG: DegT/DnrJ/EryC1/StrS family aminotransferase [Acidimicrobiales bacterium]|nr:DegT/DnrJ/EryC1/StrS family aminotransferase [Acidimicrobiales bacterium]
MTQGEPAEAWAGIGLADPSITDEDVAAVAAVLRSGWLTSGRESVALEQELAEYLDCPHVVTVSSGTAALELSFAYLGLPAGARVGVPTWTFPASAFAPYHHGASIVLLDSDPETMNLSVESLDAALDEGLDALVMVHFGGTPVSEVAHQRCAAAGIPIVEDAAHAFGASDHRGKVAGTGTAGAAFSFYATKNLTSGEGGALATDDPELARFATAYRLHGLTRKPGAAWDPDTVTDIVGPGYKSNLSDILAALARSQLHRFDDLQARRRAAVLRYRENLAGIDGLAMVPRHLDEGNADHLLTVALPAHVDRRKVFGRLDAVGIGTSLHFRPLHDYDWFAANTTVGPSGVPVAEEMAHRLISLPLHPGLTEPEVDRVCEVFADALS